MGAIFGDALGDTHRLGLDAIYPVFFLSLLIAELRDPASRWAALAGGLARPRAGADPLLRACRNPPASTVALLGLARRPA